MDYSPIISQIAQQQGISPALAIAVAQKESSGQQWTAVGNPVVSAAGAIGIFQLMPATAADLGVNPYDPVDNIRGGVKFLAEQIRQFGLPAGLWAYNWGPGRVQAYQNGTGSAPPPSVVNYANDIMAAANAPPSVSVGTTAPPPSSGPNLILWGLGIAGGVILLSVVL